MSDFDGVTLCYVRLFVVYVNMTCQFITHVKSAVLATHDVTRVT